jgi:hypothetical protein
VDQDLRRAAWRLYHALNYLASAELVGELETSYEPDGRLFEGDLDFALRALNEDGPRVARAYPDLVERVRVLLTTWESLGAGRLRGLLPILRELEEITGTSLPLPPGAT